MSFSRKPLLSCFLLALSFGALSAPSQAAPEEAQKAEVMSSKVTTIDINTATVNELTLLPQIGPVTAKRIVDYRKAVGPFRKLEELLNVKGIGERTFTRIRTLVTLGKTSVRQAASTKR